jgi:Fe-S-cluster containining protein
MSQIALYQRVALQLSKAEKKLRDVSVPCGACHACCRAELIPLYPEYGDDLLLYPWHYVANRPTLLQRSNGDCWYLQENGRCAIYDRRPRLCRVFDCRVALRRNYKMRTELKQAAQDCIARTKRQNKPKHKRRRR